MGLSVVSLMALAWPLGSAVAQNHSEIVESFMSDPFADTLDEEETRTLSEWQLAIEGAREETRQRQEREKLLWPVSPLLHAPGSYQERSHKVGIRFYGAQALVVHEIESTHSEAVPGVFHLALHAPKRASLLRTTVCVSSGCIDALPVVSMRSRVASQNPEIGMWVEKHTQIDRVVFVMSLFALPKEASLKLEYVVPVENRGGRALLEIPGSPAQDTRLATREIFVEHAAQALANINNFNTDHLRVSPAKVQVVLQPNPVMRGNRERMTLALDLSPSVEMHLARINALLAYIKANHPKTEVELISFARLVQNATMSGEGLQELSLDDIHRMGLGNATTGLLKAIKDARHDVMLLTDSGGIHLLQRLSGVEKNKLKLVVDVSSSLNDDTSNTVAYSKDTSAFEQARMHSAVEAFMGVRAEGTDHSMDGRIAFAHQRTRQGMGQRFARGNYGHVLVPDQLLAVQVATPTVAPETGVSSASLRESLERRTLSKIRLCLRQDRRGRARFSRKVEFQLLVQNGEVAERSVNIEPVSGGEAVLEQCLFQALDAMAVPMTRRAFRVTWPLHTEPEIIIDESQGLPWLDTQEISPLDLLKP